MDRLDVEAVYEHGTLKLPRELPLRDGEKVAITIHSTESASNRAVGAAPWNGSLEDLDYLILSDDNTSLETP
jgi:predicted DNA-binding antitoxin AbrB/MazE fold protein